MTKNDYKIIYSLVEALLNQKLGNYTNATKTAAEFEDMYMREYAGGAAIDHVLFRRFLRQLEIVKEENVERLKELENLDITNIYDDLADIEHPQENYGYFLKAENGIEIYVYNGTSYDKLFGIDTDFDEDSTNPLENGTITKRFDDVETDITDHDNRLSSAETQVQQNTIAIGEIGMAGGVLQQKVQDLQEQIDQIGLTKDKEVIVVLDYQALQAVPEPQKEVIYVCYDTQDIYIWDGTQYVQINTTAGSGTNIEVVTNLNQAYERNLSVGNYIIDLIKDKTTGGVPIVGHEVTHEYYQLKVNSTSKTLFSTLGWAEWASPNWLWHYYAYRGSGGGATDIVGGNAIEVTEDEQTGQKTISAKGYTMQRGMMQPNTTFNAEHGIIAFENQGAKKVFTTNGEIHDIDELVTPATIDSDFNEDSANPLENGTITKRFDDIETDVTNQANDIEELQTQVGQNTIAISELNTAGTELQQTVQDIQEELNDQKEKPEISEVISVPTVADLNDIQDPQQDAIYIVESANEIYTWNGQEFINTTGEQIVCTSYAQVRALTTVSKPYGRYKVVYNYNYRIWDSQSSSWKYKNKVEFYTLFIPSNTTQKRLLTNYEGWAEAENGDWSWHTYIYEETLIQKFQPEPDENNRIYIRPNALYELSSLTELEIHLESPEKSVGVDTADEYLIRFTIDQNATAQDINIRFAGSGYRWHDQAPTWVAGATYEMSVLDKYIIVAQFN